MINCIFQIIGFEHTKTKTHKDTTKSLVIIIIIISIINVLVTIHLNTFNRQHIYYKYTHPPSI